MYTMQPCSSSTAHWQCAVVILLCIFSQTNLLGAQKKIMRYTIAVSGFEANNCKSSLAKAASEILAGKVFGVDFFILLERSQMDLIMKEKGIQGERFTNPDDAARLGKMLSVQKMVVGSLSRLGKSYRLEVRVVNVENGRVDISLSERVADEGSLEKAASAIAVNIERFYRGFDVVTGEYDLSIAASVVHSFGSLAKGTGFGFGGRLKFYWNRPFGWPVPFIFSTGFYAFTPLRLKTIDYFYMFPIEVHLGYKVNLTKNIGMLPWMGGGYLLMVIRYDPVMRIVSLSDYKNGFYYNPVLTAGIEFTVFLHDRVVLLVNPTYHLFFETRKIGHFAGGEFGAKILF